MPPERAPAALGANSTLRFTNLVAAGDPARIRRRGRQHFGADPNLWGYQAATRWSSPEIADPLVDGIAECSASRSGK
jgi:hypothetical protein